MIDPASLRTDILHASTNMARDWGAAKLVTWFNGCLSRLFSTDRTLA